MKARIARFLVPSVLNAIALTLAPAGAQINRAPLESLIRPGMSVTQVQNLMGPPFHQFHFAKEGLTTLTYGLPERSGSSEVLDIDIDASGRVVQLSEAVEVIGHSKGSR